MNNQTVTHTDRDFDPTHTQELGHGNTIAAWALVIGVGIGSLVTGVALFLELWTILIIGVVIIALGIALGIGLKAAGYGVGGKKTIEREAARATSH